MELEQVAIENLTPHPRNARSHPQNQLVHLQQSLDEYDWVRNVVTAKDGTILIGHGIVAAAKRNGHKTVPVYRTQLEPDDPKAIKLMVLENSVQDFAIDDEEQLATLLRDIEETEGLAGTGYDESALQDLLSDLQAEEFADSVEDVEPDEPPEEPVTETGDVWLCGEHRVVCGDCISTDVIGMATGNTRVGLVYTDPPYGVDYDGGANNKRKRQKLAGDDGNVYGEFVPLLPIANDAAMYIWFAGTVARPVYDAIEENEWTVRALLVWHKLNAHYGGFTAQYMQKHEAFLYAVIGTPYWNGPTNETTVWEYKQPNRNEWHPTEKPVELATRAIKNSSKVGSTVFDGFLGSGTTLIAAEQLGRVCYGIEIEPRYVDVAVKRWMKATNKHAKLESTGELFPVSDDGG